MTKQIALVRNLKIAAVTFALLLAVVEQTRGQTSTADTSSSSNSPNDPNLSSWGIDSIHRMTQGVRGAASCATSSCHGGPKAGVSSLGAPRGSEYPLWLERDPHAQSWKTISSEASLKILTKLGILRDGKIAYAEGFQNCLACHNTDPNITAEQLSPRIAEGVGCESCHGPAEAWYDRHYQGSASAKFAKTNLGLTDSRPLVPRAKICASCHVGSKDRDMNHDIIAAGHPALYFDMAVYHEAYPKHWRDKDQDQSNFRSKLWLAGKIAMADAELELLESRACKSLPVSTWPELSNYQCNSCHFQLGGITKANSQPDHDVVTRGRAPVRDWNLNGFAMLSAIPAPTQSELVNSLNGLRELLQSPNPDSKLIAAKSHQLRIQLFNSINENGKPTLPAWSMKSQTAISIQRLDETRQSNSWELAAEAYTAVWATHPNTSTGHLALAMNTIRNGLLFPKDLMMPHFPRQQSGGTSPSLREWNEALQQAVVALKNDELR